MIRLNKNYAIGFDSMNIILYKINILGEKSKNQGEETFIPLGYYGDMEQLIARLLSKEIMDCDFDSLKALSNKIDEFKKEILESLKKYE